MAPDPAGKLIFFLASTALLSLVLTGLATAYARRRGLLDQPGARHSHSLPTPRGGGAGLVLALVAASLVLSGTGFLPPYWYGCALPGFLALAALGWWDDHRPLPAALRLAVQAIAAFYLLACLALPHGAAMPPIGWILAWVAVLWLINLYNFMDGSNGMAGLQGVFCASLLAWLFISAGDPASALLAALVASTCLGFLPWNLGRARVFMGDVGSVALGFAFAVLLVQGVAGGSFSAAVAVMVMLVFACDATLTLLLRVLRGEQWYNPHKQHLYQRLIERGWSHGRVALLYQSINLVLVAPAIVVAVNEPAWEGAVGLALALLLGLCWVLAMKRFGVLVQAR